MLLKGLEAGASEELSFRSYNMGPQLAMCLVAALRAGFQVNYS